MNASALCARVLLAGRPGVGKTTVVRDVIAAGRPIAGGFWTEEMRERGGRVGFRVEDVHTGREAVLSHVDFKAGPRVGRYGVDVAAFERVGVAALREALGRDGCVVIDEIGKMELKSQAFPQAVLEVLDSGQPVLATIPAYRVPFVDRVRSRPDVTIVEVTPANRSDLPAQLISVLGLSCIR